MKVLGRIALVAVMFVVVASDAQATRQIRDQLHTRMFTHEVLGTDIPREMLYEDPLGPWSLASSCWRGFVADWIVDDDTLYLASVSDYKGDSLSEKADALFAKGLVEATWFTGTMFSPKICVLPLVTYLDGGIYLGWMNFEFKDGTLVRSYFNFEPIGVVILLIELTILWLIVRSIRKRKAAKDRAQKSEVSGQAPLVTREKGTAFIAGEHPIRRGAWHGIAEMLKPDALHALRKKLQRITMYNAETEVQKAERIRTRLFVLILIGGLGYLIASVVLAYMEVYFTHIPLMRSHHVTYPSETDAGILDTETITLE